MELQPLTRAVLSPEIKSFIANPGDNSLLTVLPYWSFPSDQRALKRLMLDITDPKWNKPATTNPVALGLVTTALTSTSVNDVTSITSIIEMSKKAGMSMFLQQVAAVNGRGAMQADQRELLTGVLEYMFGEVRRYLSKTLDYTKSFLQYAIVAITVAFKSVEARLIDALYNRHGLNREGAKAVAKLWFSDAMLECLATIGMGPWIVMTYAASFVPGSWNLKNRENVSFYDYRYAEFYIYDAMTTAYSTLLKLNPGSQPRAALQARMDAIVTFVTREESTKVGGEAVLNMYMQVARLSKFTKDVSMLLESTNNNYVSKRERAINLYNQHVSEQEELRRLRIQVGVWGATVGIIILVSSFLIATQRLTFFYLQAAIVILILSIFLGVQFIRDALNRRM